jgi:hypothetical protein
MKKIKVSILALSVLVGGAVLASAAKSSVTVGATSLVEITNATPLVYLSVGTLPTGGIFDKTNTQFVAAAVDTDGSGKISGVANLQNFTFASNSPSAIATFYVTAKGKVSASKMGQASIQISLKGSLGYSASDTNLTTVRSRNNSVANGGTLNLQFKTAKPAVLVAVSTNEGFVTYAALGTLSGTIKYASKSIGTTTLKNVPASVIVGVEKITGYDMQVVSFGKKFAAIVANTLMDYSVFSNTGGIDGATGTGNVNNNNQFNLTLKSPAGGNSSLKWKGSVALKDLNIGGTNTVPSETIGAANITGKIAGQAVEGVATWSRFIY